MIVVEGFDSSGKSTLAGKIGEILGWSVLHTGGPTKSREDVIHCLMRSQSRLRQRVVQDRITHISESVYSMLTAPDKAAMALNAIPEIAIAELVIYCRPPHNFLLEAFREHRIKEHDDFMKLEQTMRDAPSLIKVYDTVMNMTAPYLGARLVTYDRSNPDSESHVLELVKRKFR